MKKIVEGINCYDLEKIPEQFKRLFETMVDLYGEKTPDSLGKLKFFLSAFPITEFKELVVEYQSEDMEALGEETPDKLVSCLVAIFSERTGGKGDVSAFLQFLVDNLTVKYEITAPKIKPRNSGKNK